MNQDSSCPGDEARVASSVFDWGWLEWLLGAAVLALVLQLNPNFLVGVVAALDMRAWDDQSWFLAFLVFFAVLCAIRFGPEFSQVCADQFERHRLSRAAAVKSRSDAEKRAKLQEERELYARMIEARKRQV